MKKILVVVDMQNDFIDGTLGNTECEKVVSKVVDVINSNEYDDIYLTRDTHYKNYLNTQEGRKLPVEHCLINTDGWKIKDEILESLKNKKFTYINKPTFGSLKMANTFISEYCNEQRELEITLVGVCTGICVISNTILLKAALPEAKIKVIADACACVTTESHKNALEAMKMCQIEVIGE